MNIVTPYAKIVAILPGAHGDGLHLIANPVAVTALRWIERIGRVSHRSEEAQTDDSWKRFIPAVVMGHGDWSIVEHAFATVEFYVDRGITHEIVRHRLFSYTQESTRFVSYVKKMPPSFIEPPGLSENLQLQSDWRECIKDAEHQYRMMLAAGMPPQIARSVFPNALASKIIMTGNLRSWRWFLMMRTTREAHPQMRQVTLPLLAEFKRLIPLLYDDIAPEARQADNVRLPK